MLTDGLRELLLAAESERQRQAWVNASCYNISWLAITRFQTRQWSQVQDLNAVTNAIWAQGATTGLPGRLETQGSVEVALAEWKEASRDFTR